MNSPKSCRVTSPNTPKVTIKSNAKGNGNNRTTFIPIASPYIDHSISKSSSRERQYQQRRPHTIISKKSHDCSIVSGITSKGSYMSYPTNLQAGGGDSVDSTDVASSEWGDESNSSTIKTTQSYICPQTTSERQNGGVVHTDLRAYHRATPSTPTMMSDDGIGSRQSASVSASASSRSSSHGHTQIHGTNMESTLKIPVMATTTRKTKPLSATVNMLQQPSVKHKTPLKLGSAPLSVTTNSPTIATTNSTNTPIKMTLEKRLFHALHKNKNNSLTPSSPPRPKPSIKEFKEAWSFANTTRSFYKNEPIDLVLDVAGGHGALAALFLALTDAKKAVVINPADVVGGGVQDCWGEFYKGKSLEYRYECLRTGLRAELDRALTPLLQNESGGGMDPKRILVVACHACQHLTDETLEIACSYGVNVTVMPCCQNDPTDGSSFKEFSKQVGIDIHILMDILTAGKVMSWNNGQDVDVQYQVRMKTIDEEITPQKRLILCKAGERAEIGNDASRVEDTHKRLETAYTRVHGNNRHQQRRKIVCTDSESSDSHESTEMEHTPLDHREQGVRLSIMKFAKRVLRKSSREGTSAMNVAVEECISINEDIDGQTASISETLLWKNLRLLSLLNFTKKSQDEDAVNIGTEKIGDIGNPVHGVAAVRHIQDTLSTETMAAAGIFFVGSILSVIFSPSSFSQNR